MSLDGCNLIAYKEVPRDSNPSEVYAFFTADSLDNKSSNSRSSALIFSPNTTRTFYGNNGSR